VLPSEEKVHHRACPYPEEGTRYGQQGGVLDCVQDGLLSMVILEPLLKCVILRDIRLHGGVIATCFGTTGDGASVRAVVGAVRGAGSTASFGPLAISAPMLRTVVSEGRTVPWLFNPPASEVLLDGREGNVAEAAWPVTCELCTGVAA
jgi:hypothetical protein